MTNLTSITATRFFRALLCYFLIRLIKLMMPHFFSLHLKDDLENAKYISRLFSARHKFYKQNKICTEWVLFLQSCFLTLCFETDLSFSMSGFVCWLFFFLVTYVSYSFPSFFFYFSFCFNQQQEQRVEKFCSEPCEAWCSPVSQPDRVLNWSPWSLPFIIQSICINGSESWHMLTCQNVNCSGVLKKQYHLSASYVCQTWEDIWEH